MVFGIFIGVDVNGRVWLIEMNPKPGRDIFRKLGREDRYALAVRRPLQYALHLLNQQNQSGLPSKDDEQNMQSDQNAEHEQKAPNA
ncbi:YheC/YheD family protein [Microbacteriaceae bacterium K1510]|nr:YheC/YheD family protein [Microbacteriaceae bacterium K1510]